MLRGTRDEREALRKKERFIVESILPAGEVHLIGGASGVGKTTWILQWLRDWSEGKPVFGGLKSYPCPFVYVCFDRPLLSFDRTLRRLQLDDWDFPAFYAGDLALSELTIFKICERFPEVMLYVIDGFQSIVRDPKPGSSQNKSDMLWCMDIGTKILSQGKTILGITHTPKQKRGEGYVSSRSNFLGSQSMLASTGTLITVDNPKEVRDSLVEVRTDEREVLIEGPNFPALIKHYTRDSNGKFVEYDPEVIAAQVNLDVYLQALPTGTLTTTKDLTAKGIEMSLSRDQVKRWIQKQVQDGILMRKRDGEYLISRVN